MQQMTRKIKVVAKHFISRWFGGFNSNGL